MPTQAITINVGFDRSDEDFVHETTQDIACDFVDGIAFGDALGVGVRAVSGWWTVSEAVPISADGVSALQELWQRNSSLRPIQSLQIELVRATRIAPGQSRIVPIQIKNTEAFFGDEIILELTLTNGSKRRSLKASLPIKQHQQWPPSLIASYFYAGSLPTQFSVVPPRLSSPSSPRTPILALRAYLLAMQRSYLMRKPRWRWS